MVFTDLQNRKILERSSVGDTYYVYNDYGQLRFVLTPNYKKISDKAINAYEYRYNNRGLVKEKILPGCGSVLYWYDNADRLVCMQDSVMRASGKYRFCLYDNLGRLAIQGLCTKCSHDESLVFTAEFTKGASGLLGTGYVLPSKCMNELVNPVLEVVNYYDDHDFMSNSYFSNMSMTETCCQTGQLTGTVSRANNGEYISQAMMYDLKGNLTKCVSREIGGRIVTSDNSYSFTNNVLSSVYNIDVLYGSHLSLSENYEYNQYNDKKSKATLTVGHGGSAVSSSLCYAYDSLGRLSKVTRPLSAVSNKDVSYTYDLHGWMKSITANGFTENLHYADGNGTPCYNGNISSIDWQSYPTTLKRAYRYTYDNANRLTLAEYYDGSNKTDRYTEKAEYDSNGNATRIIRHGMTSKGFDIMDNLTVSYHGNQLSSVSEAADDYNAAGSFEYKKVNGSGYIYNGNGSLVADKSRGIAYISYDFNNNPDMVYFTNGGITKYVYSSAGQKLRVVHYTAVPNISRTWGEKPAMLTAAQILSADSTDYLLGGRLVMQNGRVDKVMFDGGYAQATASTTTADTFAFYYFNQDHLGNNCEVLDAKGTLTQATNYYPFGAPYSDASSQLSPSLQPYKFGGKELDLMHGLNTFDFGARQHDPILIRWDRMDPLSEKYYPMSTYNYCADNPVRFIDPDGRAVGLPEEILFAIRHPIAATRIGAGVTHNATDISTNATRFATTENVLYGTQPGQVEQGSENGAFRHTLWQAEITSEFGADIAKQAGDAHEDGPNIDMNQTSFSNLNDADKSVDLHNNNIGREIGIQNKGIDMNSMAKKVLNVFATKGLYTAQKQKDGSYKLVKTKLSPSKAKQLMRLFNQRDKNGMTSSHREEVENLNRNKALQYDALQNSWRIGHFAG